MRPLLLLLLVSTPAAAWTPMRAADGTPLRWPAESWPLGLVDDTPAWARAAARWTATGLPAGFRPVPAADGASPGVISVRRISDAAEWASTVGDSSLVGYTFLQFDARTQLTHAEVVLNTARFTFRDDPSPAEYGLETVFTHELGHAMGLGHSCGRDSDVGCFEIPQDDDRLLATMAQTVPPGTPAHAPNADDAESLADAVLDGAPAPRVPVLRSVTATGRRAWRVEVEGLEPGDLVRVRRDAVQLATIDVRDGEADIEADTAPLDLEVWTTAGQGLYAAGALVAGDVEGEDAGAGDDEDAGAGGGAGDGGSEDGGGCAAVPGPGLAPLAVCMGLWMKRRRRGG